MKKAHEDDDDDNYYSFFTTKHNSGWDFVTSNCYTVTIKLRIYVVCFDKDCLYFAKSCLHLKTNYHALSYNV
jgi:hypothetical protein